MAHLCSHIYIYTFGKIAQNVKKTVGQQLAEVSPLQFSTECHTTCPPEFTEIGHFLDTFGHVILNTFGHVQTRLDTFGHVWTRLDTCRHVWTRFFQTRLLGGVDFLDTFGHIQTRAYFLDTVLFRAGQTRSRPEASKKLPKGIQNKSCTPPQRNARASKSVQNILDTYCMVYIYTYKYTGPFIPLS